jgi:hypothetical protein
MHYLMVACCLHQVCCVTGFISYGFGLVRMCWNIWINTIQYSTSIVVKFLDGIKILLHTNAYVWTNFLCQQKWNKHWEEESLHWQILLVELSSHWFTSENRSHPWQSISVILTAILQGASYWLPGREVSILVAQVSCISYRQEREREKKRNRKHRVMQCRHFIATKKGSWGIIWISQLVCF